MVNLKLYTCTDHDGFYPVGVASIILAYSEEQARELLDAALVARGLEPKAMTYYSLKEVPIDVAQAIILRDGDY